jgi:hypothetical protein
VKYISVICPRVGQFHIVEGSVVSVPDLYTKWKISRMQLRISPPSSLIPFLFALSNYDEIIINVYML